MSILIKGMEMPKKVEWISVNIFPDGKCFIQCWCGKNFNFAEQLTAVPVPPHGRLIDADALISRIKMQTGFCKLLGGDLATAGEVIEKGFLQEIANAPTVIPGEGETI